MLVDDDGQSLCGRQEKLLIKDVEICIAFKEIDKDGD